MTTFPSHLHAAWNFFALLFDHFSPAVAVIIATTTDRTVFLTTCFSRRSFSSEALHQFPEISNVGLYDLGRKHVDYANLWFHQLGYHVRIFVHGQNFVMITRS
ncbi:hypothetical protein PanWU01x14_089240 [Parasponia andersonii]|uniref:Uncharacterized protein n=1 Tax=Parasponia andersonii TaxID=3476 RepID=A0A2P5D7D7_PARAD|nr:hypothetical protein PanWU01x14_089240 [Parasponia andersonii]